jgi:hypothetical protein
MFLPTFIGAGFATDTGCAAVVRTSGYEAHRFGLWHEHQGTETDSAV